MREGLQGFLIGLSGTDDRSLSQQTAEYNSHRFGRREKLAGYNLV
jgi:hypothetical protein